MEFSDWLNQNLYRSCFCGQKILAQSAPTVLMTSTYRIDDISDVNIFTVIILPEVWEEVEEDLFVLCILILICRCEHLICVFFCLQYLACEKCCNKKRKRDYEQCQKNSIREMLSKDCCLVWMNALFWSSGLELAKQLNACLGKRVTGTAVSILWYKGQLQCALYKYVHRRLEVHWIE